MRTIPFLKIGEGSTAIVYKLDSSTCLKQYKSVIDELPITERVKMKPQVFSILQTLDLPGLYKVRDIYHHNGDVSGYTYDYVRSISNSSLINQDMDYILESFDNLERVGKVLTGECISIEDTNNANTIISPNGLTIIDADMYYQTRDIAKLKIRNKQAVTNYVLSKLCNGKLFNIEESNLISDIFDFDYESDKSLALQALESFKGHDLKKLFR